MIEFEEAGFSYGPRAVLSGVTLSLAPGSFHFLVGASGSGKTTLMRLCTLELLPTGGTVRHFGQAIAANDRRAIVALRRAVGVVEQDAHFLDHLPLAENVALPLTVAGTAPEARADDVAALLSWVELGALAAVRPPALSAGERRRAALARALILSPDLILADEPTGGVDRDTGRGLMILLAELNRMGKTVLVATHDPDLAATVPGATRLTLADGRVGAAA